MVHGEHNKSRNSGGFALIIFGSTIVVSCTKYLPRHARIRHDGIVWRNNYWRYWVLSKIFQRTSKKRVKKGSTVGKKWRETWDYLIKIKSKQHLKRTKRLFEKKN